MNIATSALGLPVLILNSNWLAIAADKNVKRALEDLTSGTESVNERGEREWISPFRGMDIELAPDGELLYANPVDWGDWVKLPVRPGDEYIAIGHGRYIRAPRVIIASNYSKSRVRIVALSNEAIKKRDKQQCQYCREFFPMDELNIDHVTPRYHGGENTWENMVCSCIPCNSKKGHRRNHEIGYKLIREPRAPMPVSETALYVEIKHPTWAPFLPHLK